MYLKSIRAQGFKSFADKLDLEINPCPSSLLYTGTLVIAVKSITTVSSNGLFVEDGAEDCIGISVGFIVEETATTVFAGHSGVIL